MIRPEHGRPWRAGLGTVRVRTTTIAVLVVGLALVVASVALLVGVRRSVVDRVRSNAELRAADIVTAIDAGVPAADLALDEGSDRFIQIVGSDGDVIAASRSAADVQSLADRAGTDVQLPFGDADDRWVVFVDRPATGDVGAVIVGRELDPARETSGTLTLLLVIVVPAVLAVVGVTTWQLTGRALAPVDAIRQEADEISATELYRRLPEPHGADEIARLATTMNNMLDRLEQSQTRQRRLISDASHELRSPVASIRQHTEVALTHPGETSLDQLAETVFAESQRLGHLVDDLILLARADERSLPGGRTPVDLDDVIFAQAEHLPTRLLVDRTGVSAGQVIGDRRQLERVVRNLATNAATHATARIAFGLAESDGDVVLTVDDDGPGVAPADRGRIFERFVRLDEARDRDLGGSGLGLAIVDEVIRAHDGRIAVSDSPLGGARFEIRLPAAP